MKPANEPAAKGKPSATITIDRDLAALLSRIEDLSFSPGFRVQREVALTRALQPYLEYAQHIAVTPLPEEVELANLYLYADYFPEDGQLDLIEQLRDVIEIHVPEEERAWLDPLHHSYLDLLEILSIASDDPARTLLLRSLGDGREFRVPGREFSRSVRVGQVLLTRLIHRADRFGFAGAAVLLSANNARGILNAAHDWRRGVEASSGTFALGEWDEFAKRHGYVLLWQVARARLGLLIRGEAGTRFLTSGGEPFRYAIALYEHHDTTFLTGGLAGWEELTPTEVKATSSAASMRGVRVWDQTEGDRIVARIRLTPIHLVVECESVEQLDLLKHRLASTFGFALHFRGETTVKPSHEWAWQEVDLTKDELPVQTVIVSAEEEQRILSALLASVYLEWADQASPALDGQTPRHMATSAEGRTKVASLIDEMERTDVGLLRTGTAAFEYNQLRAHAALV